MAKDAIKRRTGAKPDLIWNILPKNCARQVKNLYYNAGRSGGME
ncbi:MAG: hypothetical protein ACI3VB_08645 [Oscillospiraceae bacterium]